MTCSTCWRSACCTPSRAKKAVIPRPIRAGVLGMARTMRSLPSQRAMLRLGMPAATLRCSAAGV
jgi:hypothetical protein